MQGHLERVAVRPQNGGEGVDKDICSAIGYQG
jgi:hypothetical protein